MATILREKRRKNSSSSIKPAKEIFSLERKLHFNLRGHLFKGRFGVAKKNVEASSLDIKMYEIGDMD